MTRGKVLEEESIVLSLKTNFKKFFQIGKNTLSKLRYPAFRPTTKIFWV